MMYVICLDVKVRVGDDVCHLCGCKGVRVGLKTCSEADARLEGDDRAVTAQHLKGLLRGTVMEFIAWGLAYNDTQGL